MLPRGSVFGAGTTGDDPTRHDLSHGPLDHLAFWSLSLARSWPRWLDRVASGQGHGVRKGPFGGTRVSRGFIGVGTQAVSAWIQGPPLCFSPSPDLGMDTQNSAGQSGGDLGAGSHLVCDARQAGSVAVLGVGSEESPTPPHQALPATWYPGPAATAPCLFLGACWRSSGLLPVTSPGLTFPPLPQCHVGCVLWPRSRGVRLGLELAWAASFLG